MFNPKQKKSVHMHTQCTYERHMHARVYHFLANLKNHFFRLNIFVLKLYVQNFIISLKFFF